MANFTAEAGRALIESGIAWGVAKSFKPTPAHKLIAKGSDGTELYYNENETPQTDIFGEPLPAIFLTVKFNKGQQ